jgi:hypothetical protein
MYVYIYINNRLSVCLFIGILVFQVEALDSKSPSAPGKRRREDGSAEDEDGALSTTQTHHASGPPLRIPFDRRPVPNPVVERARVRVERWARKLHLADSTNTWEVRDPKP